MAVASEFADEMLAGFDRLEREVGYRPTRFRQMIAEHGGVAAAKRVLASREIPDGFATLALASRLELSVEAFVLRARYRELFTPAERREARRRLSLYEFDVKRLD